MASGLPTTYARWEYSTATGGLEKSLHLNPSAPAPWTTLSASAVLVRVHATALNPVDYKVAEAPILSYVFPRKPATPCLDFAGTVEAAGSASGFEAGARVFGRFGGPTQHGGLAQYTVIDGANVARLPEGVSFVDGACLGTAGQTALQSLKGVREGSRVFVNGSSGGVGCLTVQVAKLLGATQVTGTCSGRNAALVKELGADEVVDYQVQDPTEAVKKGAWDLVVDNVGSPAGLHKACDGRVTEGGRVVQVGAGFSFGSLVQFIKSGLLPAALGGAKTKWGFLALTNDREGMDRLAKWTADGQLKVVVDSTFSFKEADKAFAKLKTGRAQGKIVVASYET